MIQDSADGPEAALVPAHDSAALSFLLESLTFKIPKSKDKISSASQYLCHQEDPFARLMTACID